MERTWNLEEEGLQLSSQLCLLLGDFLIDPIYSFPAIHPYPSPWGLGCLSMGEALAPTAWTSSLAIRLALANGL